MFSPYYAWSGRENPLNHCSINVALYGKSAQLWSMTERNQATVTRDKDSCAIGPSSARWTGNELVLDIHETANPIPRAIIGQIRLKPELITNRHFELDTQNRHAWWPIAPRARVEVSLDKPNLSWAGSGYLDMNAGDEPLEDGFDSWDWSRTSVKDGAAVFYDAIRKDGSEKLLSLNFDKTGAVHEFEPPQRCTLSKTPIWRIPRRTHAQDASAKIVKTLEDTPFYARSIVNTKLFGETTTAMHESLSLKRFETNWVKCLLAFRMPRIFWS